MSSYMNLLLWTNPLTNRVTYPLAVRRLTVMRTSCKFEGISDALPLCAIIIAKYNVYSPRLKGRWDELS